MKFFRLLTSVSLSFCLTALANPSQDSSEAITVGLNAHAKSLVQRIRAQFIVMDYPSACSEAADALQQYPNAQIFYELYIKALAEDGKDKQMWTAWNLYQHQFPEEAMANQDLQECMAWGTLKAATESPLPIVRLFAMIGAFFGDDAKSIPILCRFCNDKSSIIRSAAVQLSSHLRDARLCDEILMLWAAESNWRVRIELIKAIGKMKMEQGGSLLLNLLADEKTSAEEKAAAVSSLLFLFEEVDRSKSVELAHSNRAGLRLLACKVVTHIRSIRDIDLMIQLASDNHSEVRIASLHALGLLKASMDESTQQTIRILARRMLQDPAPEVQITAAWLLTLLHPQSAEEAFMPLMRHPRRAIRIMASGAVASTGKYGLELAKQLFQQSQDPFVKMNLTVGLIYQQEELDAACVTLERILASEQGKWMWEETGPFRYLAPSTVMQDDDIPNAPEAINQMTRLEILNMLAILKHPGAEMAIRQFLQQRKWGITGVAAALLLMEGDESSLDLVQDLLTDSNPHIRMQAALTLSLWGGKEEAIEALEKGYSTADRETKEKILEGLGKIGSRKSIPFLLSRLQEPQQTLRLIAASSLLQCLYH